MAGDTSYSVRVLKTLETLLIGEGLKQQAETVGAVTMRLRTADDLEATLRQLYAVRGWDQVALRLLWYEQQAKKLDPAALEGPLKEMHVRDLHDAVIAVLQGPASAPAQSAEPPPPPSQDLSDALVRFDAAVGVLKQRSSHGDEFIGIEQPLVEILQEETDALRMVASADGNEDVVRFATALSIFLVFVTDKGKLGDVRTMNIIDNANLTLQTVLQAMGATDYDSLAQTTQLLESPVTLLD
jgi:hypothetical protein